MKLIAQSENIENIVDKNSIYVDKTEYIYNLTKQYDRVFFSRPRRFGKSLTLNTIGTLFEKGVDPYFKGTWIYDKWDQDKYPVLHLSFLEYSATDLTEFKRQLCLSIYKFSRTKKIQDVLDVDCPYDNLPAILYYVFDYLLSLNELCGGLVRSVLQYVPDQ